jgi:hypothetical protein
MVAVSAIIRAMRLVWPGEPRIGGDALAQAFRLADIEHDAVFIEHAIDARTDRRMFPMGANGARAPAQRGGRRLAVQIEFDARFGLDRPGFQIVDLFHLLAIRNIGRRVLWALRWNHRANLVAARSRRKAHRRQSSLFPPSNLIQMLDLCAFCG